MANECFEISGASSGPGLPTTIWIWIKARLVTGIRFLTPFVITWIVVRFLYNISADLFQPFFRDWFGHSFPDARGR